MAHAHTHMHRHTHKRTHTHICITRAPAPTYAHTHAHAHAHSYAHSDAHAHVHAHAHAHTHAHTHPAILQIAVLVLRELPATKIRVHTHLAEYMRSHVRMYQPQEAFSCEHQQAMIHRAGCKHAFFHQAALCLSYEHSTHAMETHMPPDVLQHARIQIGTICTLTCQLAGKAIAGRC